MTDYIFGEIPNNPVGTTYESRTAAMRAGVHQVNMAGISGNRDVGCVSICVNAGYEDDEDHGDWIIYTGEGGNDSSTGKQIADQSIKSSGNAALVVSEENGYPVRVLRGPKAKDQWSPASGFRYDGLFRVVEHWTEIGQSGFRIWRYRLQRMSSTDTAEYVPGVPPTTKKAKPSGTKAPSKMSGTVQRTVRNTKVTDWVKHLYGYTCQMCRSNLDLPVGNYAEGAHIRALGTPHHGPDEVENVLCLCPNDHVRLDYGAVYVGDDLEMFDHAGSALGPLLVKPDHNINIAHIQSHRARFGY